MAEEDHATLWKLIEDWAADPKTTDKARAALRERIRRFALTRVGRRRGRGRGHEKSRARHLREARTFTIRSSGTDGSLRSSGSRSRRTNSRTTSWTSPRAKSASTRFA